MKLMFFNFNRKTVLFCIGLLSIVLYSCQVKTDDSVTLSKKITGAGKDAFGIAFIPGTQQYLITERYSKNIVVFENDEFIKKIPIQISHRKIINHSHSGLLGIAVDPDYISNNFLYLAAMLSDSNHQKSGNHSILKFTYNPDKKLIQTPLLVENIIFEENSIDPLSSLSTGGRLLFLPDRTLLFSIGYRHNTSSPQNLETFGGKIIRMKTDGSPVSDRDKNLKSNPFFGQGIRDYNDKYKVRDYIYSLGHKNNQGLAIDPDSHRIYASEHGEKGGDEINLIIAGNNYGFPYFCSAGGAAYGGKEGELYGDTYPMPKGMNVNNFTRPLFIWTITGLSIAPSGMDFYHHEGPFKNSLLVATLIGKMRGVHRIVLDNNGNPYYQGTIIKGMRFRDVKVADDGAIYALENYHGTLFKLYPKKK